MAPRSATFERAGIAVTATYLGARSWTVATSVAPSTTEDSDRAHRFDNSAVSSAIRDALKLDASSPSGTRVEVRAEHIRHGVIANNTFPPTAWWFEVDPGAGGVAPDLDAAIWECLAALRLSPSSATSSRSPIIDPRFGIAALNATPQPTVWASELARYAQEWLGADAAIEDVLDFMSQLRALGHPLYSFDESDDFVTWSTWGPECPPRHLDVDVRLPAYEAPVVTVTTRDNDEAPPASDRPIR